MAEDEDEDEGEDEGEDEDEGVFSAAARLEKRDPKPPRSSLALCPSAWLLKFATLRHRCRCAAGISLVHRLFDRLYIHFLIACTPVFRMYLWCFAVVVPSSTFYYLVVPCSTLCYLVVPCSAFYYFVLRSITS